MQDAGRDSALANGALQTEKQDEEHQKASTVIYDITNACFDTFEDLVSSADAHSFLEQEQEQILSSDAPSSEEPPHDIRGLRNSFAFWIDYTGALAPVGASLDDRLHSNNDIQEMIVELLEMVEKNLSRLQRNRDENRTFPNADSQHWLSAIDSALDRLNFLANAIRQASARRYEQDMLTFASDEDEFFHAIAISYVKLKCPNARPSLREHIGDSIASRRRVILLKQRHAKKLKTRRAPKPSPGLNPEHPLPPSVEKPTANLPASGGAWPGLPSTGASRATQASKMDRQAALRHIHQRPPLSSRSSGSSQQGDSLAAEYPEAPRIEAGEKHVQCPYCLQPLPAAMMRKAPKDKYWRRHVDYDLQPYQQLSPREPYVCPFCEDKPQSIAVLGDRGNPTDIANMLVTHIAEHVKSLSFLALPGFDDEAAEEATEEEANIKIRRSVNFENSDKRLRNPGSPLQPPSGDIYVEDISLTFEDNDDEPEPQVNKKPPPVDYISPKYVINQSAHDMNNTAETEVDRFFTSIPTDEPDFSWGFIMPQVIPLSAVDSAFQKWPNHASTSAPQAEAPQDHSHWIVPFRRNRHFVGQVAILAELLKRIPPSAFLDDCQRTAIVGLGGVGKTQIALEAAFRVRHRHPDCSVFWVPAGDAASFENAYRRIGLELKVKGIDDDKVDVQSLVKTALSRENAGSWLLIIDDTDDDVELSGESTSNSPLARHLPFNRNGSILFTARSKQSAVELAGKNILKVAPMNQHDALQLLRSNLVHDKTSDVATMAELVNLLAYLPLAIRQASAYINQNTISTAQYLEVFKHSEYEMIELLSKQFEDDSRPETDQNSITTTWLISFNQILRHNPLAANYLRFMCFLAQYNIPQSLLPPAEIVKMIEAFGTLKGYFFITESATSNSCDIHPLVKLAAKNWLKRHGEWNMWATLVLRRLAEVFPFPRHENKDVWMSYLPHTQYFLASQDDHPYDEESRSKLLFNVGESFRILGNYPEAERIHQQTLELREKIFGRAHLGTLASMNSLAMVLNNQGRYKEAEQLDMEIVKLKKEVLGREHPDTLASMNNLAMRPEVQGPASVQRQDPPRGLDVPRQGGAAVPHRCRPAVQGRPSKDRLLRPRLRDGPGS
ncbi:hypothetical protein V493_00366 [Pseudogymnoascus sp. VKM F-4281 (FW-2241)]|nr:hypothetical protein V493_00366 [Pseudogymnoascus sp. VKM F-4281 (FW-2241)]